MDSTPPLTTEQWKAANHARAVIYRWFADIFAHEFTQSSLMDLQTNYANLHQSFCDLGLEDQSNRLKLAIYDLKSIPEHDRTLELAADFAHIFLLSGQDSAPPYASYYINADKMLYGKPAQQMSYFLSSHKLNLHPNFREPKDHISVYLNILSIWIKSSMDDTQSITTNAVEQAEFLQQALLNWLPNFNNRCQLIRVKTDIYPATVELLLAFIMADAESLFHEISG